MYSKWYQLDWKSLGLINFWVWICTDNYSFIVRNNYNARLIYILTRNKFIYKIKTILVVMCLFVISNLHYCISSVILCCHFQKNVDFCRQQAADKKILSPALYSLQRWWWNENPSQFSCLFSESLSSADCIIWWNFTCWSWQICLNKIFNNIPLFLSWWRPD